MTRGFEPATGAITTDDGDVIGPSLTRSGFLASPLALSAELLLENPPFASWVIERRLDGRPFRLGLYFEGERLTMVVLALHEPEFGTSWGDWSREGEVARKEAHDAWLAAIDPSIGDSPSYDWGFVQSVYDNHTAGSQIVIVYAAREAIEPSIDLVPPPGA